MAESNSLDEYKCSICVDFLKQPTLTRCGHKFCKTCIESWLISKNPCPLCKEALQLNNDIFPDKCTDRKINELRINCPNAELGCTYETLVLKLQDHISICLFSSEQKNGSLACPFIRLGCNCSKDTFATEEDFQKHANEFSDSHLKILMNKYLSLTEINEDYKNREEILKRYASGFPNMMHDNYFKWTISNDEVESDSYFSTNFYTSVYGYQFSLNLQKSSDSPCWALNIYLTSIEKFLRWPCKVIECKLAILRESKEAGLMTSCCNRSISRYERLLTLEVNSQVLRSFLIENELLIQVYMRLKS